jgi:proteasome accessory factor C
MSREDVVARLGRLLAVVPWIAEHAEGVTLEEVAAEFGVPVARIEKDLQLLGEVEPVALSNVAFYEEDGRWFVDGFGNLGRPLRLTQSDAFGLIASAQAMLQAPGRGRTSALATAMTKVADAIGGAVDGLEVHIPVPPLLGALQAAMEAGACVEIEYYSAGRDDVTSRVVEPLALFTVEGRWHMAAYCRSAAGERDFRVDRVHSAVSTGESFEKRAPTLRTDVAFDPSSVDVVAVRITVQPEQRWAVERYPVRDVVDNADGSTTFTVDSAGDAWLERLLLRLGPTASVLEPVGCAVGRDAALRLLELYR